MHNLAVSYILDRGGPEEMLRSCDRPPSASLLHEHLVLFAATEVLACLFAGRSAQLLSMSSSTSWIEAFPTSELVVEETFGISLPLLFAAVDLCGLLGAMSSPTHNPTHCLAAAESLFNVLDTICLATIYARPNGLRVQAGNLLFRHALLCQLLLHGFSLSPQHPRVQQSAAAILELLIEVTCTTGLVACLLFPLLVGASLAPGGQRDTYLSLLEFMRMTCGCLDIVAAKKVLQEVWHRSDQHLPEATVMQVLKSSNLAFFLV